MFLNFIKILNFINASGKSNIFYLIIILIISSFIESLSVGVIFSISNEIITVINNQKNSSYSFFGFSFELKENFLFFIMFLTFTLFITKNFLLIIVQYIQSNFIYKYFRIISNEFFSNYINLNYQSVISKQLSDYSQNIMIEIFQFTTKALQPFVIFLTEISVLILLLAILLILNTQITLIIILNFIIIFGIYYYFSKKIINRWGKKRQISDRNKMKIINDTFQGFIERKVYDLDNYFKNNFIIHNESSSDIYKKLYFISNLPRYLVEMVLIILSITCFIYMYYNISFKLFSLGTVYIYVAYRFASSIGRLVGSLQNIEFSNKIIDNLNKERILFQKNSYYKNKKQNLNSVKNEIFYSLGLNKISYNYDDGKNILKDVSIEFKRNEIIGIFGKSGTGKTTLINIILGLIAPKTGNILFNNQIINFVNDNNYLNQFSLVPQKPTIFNESIKDNIILFKNFDKKKFDELCDVFDLKKIIDTLPDKENSILGEKGMKFSGGQLQKIGIARAFYKDSNIIILDEATNALDKEAESEIFKSIKNLSKNKLLILISHNTSMLNKFCSKVYKLENNKLIESK